MADIGFESFWNERRAEISKIFFQYRLEETGIETECGVYYRMYLCGIDGTELTGKYICPKKETTAVPVVLQFHDEKSMSRSWFHLSRYVAVGCSVLAPDMPDLKMESMERAIQEGLLWSRLTEILPHVRQSFVYGEGAGGAVAAACAALNPNIAAAGILYPLCCGYRTVYEKDYDTGFYQGIRQYFRTEDPEHRKEEAFFRQLEKTELLNFAPFVKQDILLGVCMEDAVTPPEAQLELFGKLSGTKILKRYEKHGHELNNFFENEWLKFLLERTDEKLPA